MEKVISVVLFLSLFLLAFAIWAMWYHIATRKKLKQHQIEWNRIKEEVRGKANIGAFDANTRMWDAYVDYCHKLLVRDGGSVIGACFPRF